MKKLIVAAGMFTALCGLAVAGTRPEPQAEAPVSIDQLGAEVDARLHADLTRLTREAAERNAASRHGRGVKVASR